MHKHLIDNVQERTELYGSCTNTSIQYNILTWNIPFFLVFSESELIQNRPAQLEDAITSVSRTNLQGGYKRY